MIPKFKDVLVNDEFEPEKLRDALKTLNENVHHQVFRLDRICHTFDRKRPTR